jgi:formate dehydrogenase iron-sulfur subunit
MTLRLFIPVDAGALAVGAEEVAAAIGAAAAQRKVAVEIVRTGSRGLIGSSRWSVEKPAGRVAYGPVASSDAGSARRYPRRRRAQAAARPDRRHSRFSADAPDLRAAAWSIRSLATIAHGGYWDSERALAPALKRSSRRRAPGLRGRGGADPTGIKWRTVAQTQAPQKYVVCNADEGDSGTFADRMIMEGDPFVLIEGMTIAAIAVGATKGYVYIRSEYPHSVATMEAAIAAARRRGTRQARSGLSLCVRHGGPRRRRRLCLRRGNLAARQPEGKRGLVRAKPPLPAHKGLFGRPT